VRTVSNDELAICWLQDSWSRQAALVGGKAATLGRLAAHFPVPTGFCLTGLAPGPGQNSLPDQERYQQLLAGAYQMLAQRCGRLEPPVAVRSSAVDEDGHTASFAGVHETFLNLAGHAAVTAAVHKCLASFTSARACAYRARRDLEVVPPRFAVLVQELIIADVSGVVFSIDPVTGKPDRIVVNASWGLGESVVAGTAIPDTYIVDRREPTRVQQRLADKRRMTVAVPGGVAEVGVPERLRQIPALDQAQVTATARLAVELEERMGHPVDVEFAWAQGRLHLLQCRPVTTVGTPDIGRERP
jgi:phosphoenolpyruvate synthase/pyruvate phosphate dikinase